MAEDTPPQTQPPSKGRSLGPTGDTVRQNIRAIRDAQGISGPELSEQMRRFGRAIPPLGIHRIEAGQRRVDVDDLVAFAAVLGVSPSSLLMPSLRSVTESDLVEMSGWRKPVNARLVWRWLTAREPLIHGVWFAFMNHAVPGWERAEIEHRMFDGDSK